MNKKAKEQLARELSQVAIACLAAATGGLFLDPMLATAAATAAAGSGTALSRMLDRINLGRSGNDYIEAAQAALLELAQHSPDDEVDSAFALARTALLDYGLTARQFARLDFDEHKAATKIAQLSGWPKLAAQDKDGQATPAFQCLEALYKSYRQHKDHRDELEQAFQNELLARTENLDSLEEELRPLAAAMSWRSLLEMPSSQYYPEASPTLLLSPRYQMLPYQPRLEDEAFNDWLEQTTDSPIGIAIVQAPGGTGKTRWLLEHCELRDSRWRMGFLRNEDNLSLPVSYQAMLNSPQKVLVVVDYVEDRPEQLARLLDAAVHALNGAAQHLRIVLLSRNLTDQWWDNMRPRLQDRARGWVTRDSQVLQRFDLVPLSPTIEDRQAIFSVAVDTLRPHLSEPVKSFNSPDLTPSFYADPLFIQLAALSLLRGGDAPLNDTDLLDETLDHEAKYWIGDGLQRDQVEPVLAVITLWQGLPPGKLHALIERWPNPDAVVSSADPTRLAQRLCRLYPGENQGIAPLLPDRLGEAVILQALSHDAQSVVQAAFGPEVADTNRQQAFSVLTRMPASAQDRLAAIGRVLADLLRQHGKADFARKLMTQLPEYSVGLAKVNEAAACMVREHLLAHPQDSEDYHADLAHVLNYHGITLANLGRREDALNAAQEAVKLYRQLAAQRPDAFTPDLAMSLNNLASFLSELGRREDALNAAHEAVKLYRQLAAQRPNAFTPDLVTSLGSLGRILRQDEKTTGAAACFAEGIEQLTPLFVQLPKAYAQLMQNLARDYLDTCQQSGIEPDKTLLGPVMEGFQRLSEAAKAETKT